MIPVQNTKHLMLDLDTRNAVKTGILKVVPVKYIWGGFRSCYRGGLRDQGSAC